MTTAVQSVRTQRSIHNALRPASRQELIPTVPHSHQIVSRHYQTGFRKHQAVTCRCQIRSRHHQMRSCHRQVHPCQHIPVFLAAKSSSSSQCADARVQTLSRRYQQPDSVTRLIADTPNVPDMLKLVHLLMLDGQDARTSSFGFPSPRLLPPDVGQG